MAIAIPVGSASAQLHWAGTAAGPPPWEGMSLLSPTAGPEPGAWGGSSSWKKGGEGRRGHAGMSWCPPSSVPGGSPQPQPSLPQGTWPDAAWGFLHTGGFPSPAALSSVCHQFVTEAVASWARQGSLFPSTVLRHGSHRRGCGCIHCCSSCSARGAKPIPGTGGSVQR